MKKFITLLTACILCVVAILPLSAFAASSAATLTGPGVVRAGDTITLSFNLAGSNIYAASGILSFDSNQLTLTGTKQTISAPWIVEFNGNNMVAYDNNLTAPISNSKSLFTVTFKVKSVAPGTNIKVQVKTVKTSDGIKDTDLNDITYSVTVAQPLSSDATLKGLTVSGSTLTPAFSAGTTTYSIGTVPFSVSKLTVSASANHAGAKVSVSGTSLSVGANTVTITVTAENGSKKTYKINVTRQQDPNYKASSNANLGTLNVSSGQLSPAFSPDKTEYIVYVPFEVTTFGITGTAQDKKAVSVTSATIPELSLGENKTSLTVTAEDGTKKTYTVTVMRMPLLNESLPEVTPTPTPTASPTDAPIEQEQPDDRAIIWSWQTIALLVLACLLGAVISWVITSLIIGKRKAYRNYSAENDYDF
ncbi:MAG: cadherin-like beta sandwich domain-containing protein [Clostridia bacterium]|nr:cadherin-like beta sandwich domain-containing protein [Clostridia bacterium]